MEEKPKSKGYVLRKLFFACLYLSTFTFGGGYVIVTLLKEKFVDHYHWIEEDEMLDLVAIAQSSPGAIAVNGAIIVGYKLAGIPGMLLGVPCVAVIAGLLEDWVNERLEAKNIDMPIVKNEKVREAKEEMKEKEESK